MYALKISQSWNTLVLKRNPNEMHINSYNPDILRMCQANIDIELRRTFPKPSYGQNSLFSTPFPNTNYE